MEYRLTSQAHRDIEAVARHIAQDSPAAATQVILQIQQTLGLIVLMPKIGRMSVRPGTREVPVRQLPLLIVYRQQAEILEVLTVFHTAQDPQKKL